MRSYIFQQTSPLRYVGKKTYSWPAIISTALYLSFEDAIWDMLPRFGVPKGAKILVPRFYCQDVVDNMREHGYTVSIYPQQDDYSFDEPAVLDCITQEKPDIFIDFQLNGVPTGLLQLSARKLDFRTLIISDLVHEIVYPHIDYFPRSDRHIIISSYRKVTPFPGSRVVYTRHARNSQSKGDFRYTLKSLFYWFQYHFFHKIARIFRARKLTKFTEDVVMTKHNDLIGDAATSKELPLFLSKLYDQIAVDHIIETKAHQYALYNDLLKHNLPSTISIMEVPQDRIGRVRGFALLGKSASIEKLLSKLDKLHTHFFTLLDDLLHKDRVYEVILLPLGPHLTDKDIREISRRLILSISED